MFEKLYCTKMRYCHVQLWFREECYKFYAIWIITAFAAQKMKFSIKDFFSKCHHIRRKLRIWSHLLKKTLMENFIFCPLSGSKLDGLKCQPLMYI